MQGFATNIKKECAANNNFRKVLYTAPHSQLVLMALKPGEEIGKEVHDVDQFIRIDQGDGEAILGGTRLEAHADSVFVIPAGTEHNITNSGRQAMKLYTIYSPPEHRDGTVHATKADADRDEEDHA